MSIDFIFCFLSIIFFLPIVFILFLLIVLFDRHNPIFIQQRAGINGKVIKIYKLRTMKSYNGESIVTNLGKFIRFSKIDEIPQIINIIKGEMTLIGPRPLYKEFNSYYSPKHVLRLTVKPGITGLAQIKIKESYNWKRKFNFDYIYVKNQSYKLDIYILIFTCIKILFSLINRNERALEINNYYENFFTNYVNRAKNL